jgi:hypothetical protein
MKIRSLLRRGTTQLLAAISLVLSSIVYPLDAAAQQLVCCYYERTTTYYIVEAQVVRVEVSYRLLGCTNGDCPG